jgi:hypothetical protein
MTVEQLYQRLAELRIMYGGAQIYYHVPNHPAGPNTVAPVNEASPSPTGERMEGPSIVVIR